MKSATVLLLLLAGAMLSMAQPMNLTATAKASQSQLLTAANVAEALRASNCSGAPLQDFATAVSDYTAAMMNATLSKAGAESPMDSEPLSPFYLIADAVAKSAACPLANSTISSTMMPDNMLGGCNFLDLMKCTSSILDAVASCGGNVQCILGRVGGCIDCLCKVVKVPGLC